MTEIKQPDLNNLDLEKLSPEARAEVEALAKKPVTSAEAEPWQDSERGRYDSTATDTASEDRLAVDQDRAEAAVPTNAYSDIPLSDTNKKKSLLNSFFEGKESFEELKVDQKNISDVADELMNKEK
jgi:hypothetical protein